MILRMKTALIHSVSVVAARGVFKSWTVLLAILAFSLSLVGTFIVRSGLLTSVHSFASDPARGVFILGILLLAIGIPLALFAWRGPQLVNDGSYDDSLNVLKTAMIKYTKLRAISHEFSSGQSGILGSMGLSVPGL